MRIILFILTIFTMLACSRGAFADKIQLKFGEKSWELNTKDFFGGGLPAESGTIGFAKHENMIIPFEDAVAIWRESEHALDIFLFPTALSQEQFDTLLDQDSDYAMFSAIYSGDELVEKAKSGSIRVTFSPGSEPTADSIKRINFHLHYFIKPKHGQGASFSLTKAELQDRFESFNFEYDPNQGKVKLVFDTLEHLSIFDPWSVNLKADVYPAKIKGDGVHKIFYERGIVRCEIPYRSGKRNGPSVCFYRSGKVESQGNYIDDKMEGEGVRFYESGETKGKTVWANGLPQGSGKEFYKTGELKKNTLYDEGSNIATRFEYFDKKGNLIDREKMEEIEKTEMH